MAPSPRKRKASLKANSRSKRQRKTATPTPESCDVIVLDDSSEIETDDPELKEILAHIKAQEESEKLALQLQRELNDPVASGSGSGSSALPIDLENDAEVARLMSEAWAREDTMLEDAGASSDIEILSGPQPRSSKANSNSKGKGKAVSVVPEVAARPTATAGAAPIRPDEGLIPFRDLFTETRKCSKCEKKVKPPRGLVKFSASGTLSSLTSLLHSSCKSCKANHCRGCFRPVGCSTSCKESSECEAFTCCPEIRAIAIFELLGSLDRQYLLEQAASQSRARDHAKNAVKTSTVGPGGTGYGTDYHTYTGWNSGGRGRGRGRGRGTKAVSERQTASSTSNAADWENTIVQGMSTLVDLLPAPYSDVPQAYDLVPHTSIGYLICLSQIPDILADLLRNDSVSDWISRKDTYNTMLSLLRRMADCELTIQCLIGQRYEKESTCGLEEWMWNDGEISWAKTAKGDLETAPPLYSYFKKLTKQSEAFQVGAMQMLGEGQGGGDDVDETMIQGTSLCGDIIAARDELERAITLLGEPVISAAPGEATDGERAISSKTRRKGKGRASESMSLQIDKRYVESCERFAFKHVSLADNYGNYSQFNFAPNLQSTANSTRLPKDRLHLLKELAVTATSLPPGVWVRVDEVRNDALKIMIAGPDGTPYAGGLFEFDCFMPINYPASPPLMHLRTTGHGTVRFNPNLYNTGKVCLSLLGTWAGRPEEQWTNKSTLLQVLVSIQSMILIDAPFYNEPGNGAANPNSRASIDYNRDICAKTVRWAIVDWLKAEHENGIWRDVIASHFTLYKEKIRNEIVKWSKTAPIICRWTDQMSFGGMKERNLVEEFEQRILLVEGWASNGSKI